MKLMLEKLSFLKINDFYAKRNSIHRRSEAWK